MLRNLFIENVAVIEKTDIEFIEGLNVLTGETGAGKSIIIDSLNAVLGQRISKEMIRSGADFACVTALFTDISDNVCDVLSEFGIQADEGSITLQRKISNDTKSVCRINSKPVTLSVLKEVGRVLVNIHGQHDNQSLMQSDKHINFIDALIDDKQTILKYKEEYNKLISIKNELANSLIDDSEKERKIDLLTYQIDEIENAEIEIGEFAILKEKNDILVNSEKILNQLNSSYLYLNGNDDSVGGVDAIKKAIDSTLECAKFSEKSAKIAEDLQEHYYAIASIVDDIRFFLDDFEFSPEQLQEIQDRLIIYNRMLKKYGKNESEILDYLENAKLELEKIDLTDEKIKLLEEQFLNQKKIVHDIANELSEKRKKFALVFEKSIMAELEFLDMPKVSFKVNFNKTKLSSSGIDDIEFLISTNVGETAKALTKIASGGELSRIMLAIKNVLADKDNICTLIFDEIDTGVSGRAAQKIGKKLRDVSKGRQVLCVTHSAQVASHGHGHFLIEKSSDENKTYTTVNKLNHEQRKLELARIMGGVEINDLLIQNAQQMLDDIEK